MVNPRQSQSGQWALSLPLVPCLALLSFPAMHVRRHWAGV